MIKDNRGFMMAEVIVVSAIVLSVITVMFISYNKIYGAYNTRINYYDSVTLYRLEYYRNILIENNVINDLLVKTKNSVVTSVYDEANNSDSNSLFTLPSNEKSKYNTDRVFLVYMVKNGAGKYEGLQYIIDSDKDSAVEYNNVNETFKDYLRYIQTSVTFKAHYAMFMERCEAQGNGKDINDCKYAYLEIYDGTE